MTHKFKSVSERNDIHSITVSGSIYNRIKELSITRDVSIRELTDCMVSVCLDDLSLIEDVVPVPQTPWERVAQCFATLSPDDIAKTMDELWRVKQRLAVIEEIINLPNETLQDKMDRRSRIGRPKNSSGNGAGDK